jgi:limonene-1,2-epoxide hydrolase
MPVSADNDRLVTDVLNALSTGDLAGCAEFFAEDATCQIMPGSRVEGKPAIREFFAQFAAMSIRVEVHHQIASGDIVMNERTDHLTMGDGEESIAICGVIEVHDGQVTSWRDYFLDPVPPLG